VIIIIPALAALSIHRKIDWQLFWTSVLFYGGAFAIYALIHFIRAGWKTYQDQEARITKLTAVNENLNAAHGQQLEIARQCKELEGRLVKANVEIAAKDAKIKELEEKPPKTFIKWTGFQHEPVPESGGPAYPRKYDIFAKLDIELEFPQRLSLSGCQLHMGLHGRTSVYESVNDLAEWKIWVYDGVLGEFHPVPECQELTRGIPCYGYFHFVTDKILEAKLQDFDLRFVLITDHGAQSSKEFPPNGAYWTNDFNLKVMRKHKTDPEAATT
jgi:hypothetical protein